MKRKKKFELVKNTFEDFITRINKLYIAIAIMIVFGCLLLAAYFIIDESAWGNITVGLGTGVVTSALVTLYIEVINSQIQRKKMKNYKKMLLNPLLNAVKSLYVQSILCVNEYRVRADIRGGYLLLPMEDTKKLSEFFEEMKKININSVEDNKEKKRLEDFSYVPPVYYKEVISQYDGLPFESLILDNIISQEEYDKLKHFTLLNESVKCLNALSDKKISDQDRYYTRVQLLHCMCHLFTRKQRIYH